MCDALEVSESGYYARAGRPPSRARQRRDGLLAAIEQVHAEVKGRYGSPRTTAELNARGHACTENTAAKLMKDRGIRAKAARRSVRTTDSRHSLPVADNLPGRQFDPGQRQREGEELRAALDEGDLLTLLPVVRDNTMQSLGPLGTTCRASCAGLADLLPSAAPK
jgi:transposase InsO family protein